MESLETYLHTLDSEQWQLIFTGDLNCDLSLSSLQSHSSKLVEILNYFQLEHVITDSTRITSTCESVLDILATIKPDKLLVIIVWDVSFSATVLMQVYKFGKTSSSSSSTLGYLLFLLYMNDFLNCLFSNTNRDCYNLRSNNCMLSLSKPKTHAIKKSFSCIELPWSGIPYLMRKR